MSHNRAEIDHIRLVFFQIRVEKGKRGPPSFQLYIILCLGHKSKQSRHNRVDPSDSESCTMIGPQTWWLESKQKPESWVDPSLGFQPNLEKHQSYMVWQSDVNCMTSEGSTRISSSHLLNFLHSFNLRPVPSRYILLLESIMTPTIWKLLSYLWVPSLVPQKPKPALLLQKLKFPKIYQE